MTHDATFISETSDTLSTKVIEAVDRTIDLTVLNLLWEITKRRIDEEKHRQDSANDRASKCITFSFSILASGGVLSVFAKDTLKDGLLYGTWWIHGLLALMVLSTLALLALAFRAWHCAADAMSVKDYKTWHEDDLSQVQLGDGNVEEKDREHAYLRFIIKATWKHLPENEAITDRRLGRVMNAVGALRNALIAAFCLILVGLTANFMVASVMVKREAAKISEVADVSGQNNSNSPKAEPRPVTPTPNPTSGQPLKKSEEPSVILPTTKPANTRPLRESNEGGKKK